MQMAINEFCFKLLEQSLRGGSSLLPRKGQKPSPSGIKCGVGDFCIESLFMTSTTRCIRRCSTFGRKGFRWTEEESSNDANPPVEVMRTACNGFISFCPSRTHLLQYPLVQSGFDGLDRPLPQLSSAIPDISSISKLEALVEAGSCPAYQVLTRHRVPPPSQTNEMGNCSWNSVDSSPVVFVSLVVSSKHRERLKEFSG